MTRKYLPLLVALVVVGCQAPPHASPTRPQPTVKPQTVEKASSLVHDGGIVFASALTGIADATKREAAAQLSTELSAALRAERTLRDAELLESGAQAQPAAGFVTLADEREAPPADKPTVEEEASDAPEPTEAKGSAEVAVAAPPDEAAAREGWQQLADDERERIEGRLKEREAELASKLANRLAKKAEAFKRVGEAEVTAGPDGGKAIKTAFAIERAAGKRAVEVLRKLDAAGTLIQSVQKLTGEANGLKLAAERSRTRNADGSVRIESTSRLELGGGTQEVRWEKLVKADGTLSGTGRIVRADGGTIQLEATGVEGGVETIVATDATTGVVVKLSAAADASIATATIDAGGAGSVELQLRADDDLSLE